MTRKNIFEILNEHYDIVKEMTKIHELMDCIIITDYNPLNGQTTQRTIEQIFELYLFPLWQQRGSYMSCAEMRKTLKIATTFSLKKTDELIRTLEYYVNIVTCLNLRLNVVMNITRFQAPVEYRMLCKNMDILLEHLNYEKIIFEEEQKVILVPKNPAAKAVAEIASNKDIAFAILKYNHASLKGNLFEKKRLLVSIANEYEALLDNPTSGFSSFFDKTNALLNLLNLRHNNTKGRHKNDLVTNMPKEELEKWYDELYQLLLFCILIKDNVKRKDEIEGLVKKLRKK